jgi:riboflavin biosynthesis pyrimidine reductase
MVEGGARVITAFLRERLVDQLVLTIAPMLVGGLRAIQKPVDLPRLHEIIYEPCGVDLIVWGKVG